LRVLKINNFHGRFTYLGGHASSPGTVLPEDFHRICHFGLFDLEWNQSAVQSNPVSG
jgi:hypothetical protein